MINVSVVISTVCRDSLVKTVQSLYHQNFDGNIQILIGVDTDNENKLMTLIETLYKDKPKNVDLSVIDLGYSTSAKNGGVHTCAFGGSLRTALTFLAKYQYVTYLDDDDTVTSDHLTALCEACKDNSWAFTLSNYVFHDKFLGRDTIESVGVGSGIYKQSFGGFVRPSALIIDKLKVAYILHLWSNAFSADPRGGGEDRLIFNGLKRLDDYGQTGKYTLNYHINPKDSMHEIRVKCIGYQNNDVTFDFTGH